MNSDQQHKCKKERNWPYVVSGILIAVLVILFFFMPLPKYFVESPGGAESLTPMITVNHKEDKRKGSFMMTTVRIAQGTPFNLLKAALLPTEDILTREEVMGSGTSNEQYQLIQQYYMETAQNISEMTALSLAQKSYHLKYDGVYVMSIEKKSDFKNKLRVGDIVTAVNNQNFDSADKMIQYIKSQKVGSEVSVTVKRGDEKETFKGKLKAIGKDKRPGIGITLVSKTAITSPEKIKVDSGDIGGPSAGMMFTLEMYEMLSGKDLRHGRNIAGTGEILPNGEIGRIGGIDKKVIAADKAGASIFLAPDDTITKEMKKYDPSIQSNYKEAMAAKKKYHLKIKIIPVHTIQDAIDYLEKN